MEYPVPDPDTEIETNKDELLMAGVWNRYVAMYRIDPDMDELEPIFITKGLAVEFGLI